jgi:Major Facilitator Superfamily
MPTKTWLALPVILAGVFMTILDFSIVNVAIPSIQRHLHAGAAQIQLVVAGYSLTYGAGLVTGGRLGDRFGRRRLYGIGLALFTVASTGCGLAPTAAALVATFLVVGESRSATTKRLDLRGVGLVTLGLGLLVFPLVEGRRAGWPLWAFGCLAAAVPVLWLFATHQRRLAARHGSPLVEPALVRSRSFVSGIGTVFATYASMASFFLVLAVYLQEGEGFDALGSGIAFLPLGIGFFVTSLLGTSLPAPRTVRDQCRRGAARPVGDRPRPGGARRRSPPGRLVAGARAGRGRHRDGHGAHPADLAGAGRRAPRPRGIGVRDPVHHPADRQLRRRRPDRDRLLRPGRPRLPGRLRREHDLHGHHGIRRRCALLTSVSNDSDLRPVRAPHP